MAPIRNASGTLLGQPQPPVVLDVSDALAGLTRPLQVTPLMKTVVEFGNAEAGTDLPVDGVLGPLSPQQLELKPQGQRGWKWWQLLVTRDINLTVDDRAEIDGVPFRVRARNDYASYGYFEYHLTEDFTGDQGGNTVPATRAYRDVYFDGSTTQVLQTVSDQVPDATTAVWSLQAPDGTQIDGAVAPVSTSEVRITIDPALPAGNYRLVGVA